MKKTLFKALTLLLALSVILCQSVSVYAWNSPRIPNTSTTWTYGNPFNHPYNLDEYSGKDSTAFQWPFNDGKYVAGKYAIDDYGTDGETDGTGRMPVMGWNSWNAYGANYVSADAIKATADAFVRLGLDDLGYKYIVIDDGCYGSSQTSNYRSEDNPYMTPHATRFPLGFKDVGDYIHDKGLKFGMYSNSSQRTCGGQMGSWSYEDNDAKKYVEWGVDYLKYDFCSNPWAGDGSGGAYLAGPRIVSLAVKDLEGGNTVDIVEAKDMEVSGAARFHEGSNTIYNIGGYWKDIPMLDPRWAELKGNTTGISGITAPGAAFMRQTGGVPAINSELAALSIIPGEALAKINVPSDGTYTIDYSYITSQLTGIPSERPEGTEGWTYSATYSTDAAGRYVQVDNITPIVDEYRAYVNKGAARVNAYKQEPFIQKYDYDMRVYEQLVAAAPSGGVVTFTVDLKAGDNYLRLYTEKRAEGALESYAAVKDSLTNAAKAAGRTEDVILSVCEWGYNEGSKWGYKVGEGWRASRDILSVSTSVTNDITRTSTELAGWYDPVWAPDARGGDGGYVGTSGLRGIKYCYDRTVYRHSDDFNIGLGYGWNDADMMVIGHRDLTTYSGSEGWNNGTGSTGTFSHVSTNANSYDKFSKRHDESHFNSWVMMNSVIMLGNRLDEVEVGDDVWKVITNKDSIDLLQDPLAIPGKRIKCSDGSDPFGLVISERVDIIAKPLANGDVAVMVFNLDAGPRYADKTHKDYRISGMSIDVNEIVDGIGHLMVNKNEFANADSYLIKEINTKEVRTMAKGEELSDAFAEVLALEPFYSMTFRISPVTAGDVEVYPTTIVSDYGANILLKGFGSAEATMVPVLGGGESVNAVINNGLMRLNKAPAAGVYNIVAADVVLGQIEVVDRPDNIWVPRVVVDESNVYVAFAEDIAVLSGNWGVSLNGVAVSGAGVIDGKNLTLPFTADKFVEKNTVVVSGIKYPRLFPSYSFTFTLTYDKPHPF